MSSSPKQRAVPNVVKSYAAAKNQMRAQAHFWRDVTAATVTAVAIGAVVSGNAGGGPGRGNPAATHHHDHAVGGPTHSHAHAPARYAGPTRPSARPTRGVPCDNGSRPEKVQGKTPKADYDSGRAAKGYFCNARQISHFGTTGGYRVERYVDKPVASAPIGTRRCCGRTTRRSREPKAPESM